MYLRAASVRGTLGPSVIGVEETVFDKYHTRRIVVVMLVGSRLIWGCRAIRAIAAIFAVELVETVRPMR
jgi:hypothetical protein